MNIGNDAPSALPLTSHKYLFRHRIQFHSRNQVNRFAEGAYGFHSYLLKKLFVFTGANLSRFMIIISTYKRDTTFDGNTRELYASFSSEPLRRSKSFRFQHNITTPNTCLRIRLPGSPLPGFLSLGTPPRMPTHLVPCLSRGIFSRGRLPFRRCSNITVFSAPRYFMARDCQTRDAEMYSPSIFIAPKINVVHIRC